MKVYIIKENYKAESIIHGVYISYKDAEISLKSFKDEFDNLDDRFVIEEHEVIR